MRTFTMSPIEPRTAGNLRGFGFTVTWGDEQPAAADQSTGNVDGSAGRSHSSPYLSTESTASVPVDTPANANSKYEPNQIPISPEGIPVRHMGEVQ